MIFYRNSYIFFSSAIWFIVIFFSQFYFFSSGTPQPAHIVFALASPIFFMAYFKGVSSSLMKLAGIHVLFLFLSYSMFINFSWGLMLEEVEIALLPTLFWFFGISLFFFLYLSLNSSQNVRNCAAFACFLGLLFLYLAHLLGFGEYKFGNRFNGFFNDPNQMAFWCLCTFATFFYLYDGKSKILFSLMFLVLSLLIFVTQSRSALIGLFFCLASLVLSVIFVNKRQVGVADVILSLFLLLVIICFAFYLLQTEYFHIIWDRFSSTNFFQQSDIRGYNRLLEYPNYLLFGSGQGSDYRFGSTHEIHSTWAGVIFYYGVVGFFLFFLFLWKIFAKLELPEKVMFLAPLAYSFSTYGARTPIFWVFLAAAAFAATRNISKKSSMLSMVH